MGSVDRWKTGYRARWRSPDRKSRSKVFARKFDATAFLATVEHTKQTGNYVDPAAGRVPFRQYAEEWRLAQPHRHGTGVAVEQHLRLHVYPIIGAQPIAALADAAPKRYRAIILAGAGLGLRPGELFGLTVDRVEFLKRRVRVEQQLVRVTGTGVVVGPLKTPSSYRTVPLPEHVARAIATHIETFGTHSELGLVFTNEWGAPIQQFPFSVMFANACRRAELPDWATPHDLRHFYASMLIRSGASVKAVQVRLGHSSAKTTLDVYGHLFPDEEDRTRRALEEAFADHEDEPSDGAASDAE